MIREYSANAIAFVGLVAVVAFALAPRRIASFRS